MGRESSAKAQSADVHRHFPPIGSQNGVEQLAGTRQEMSQRTVWKGKRKPTAKTWLLTSEHGLLGVRVEGSWGFVGAPILESNISEERFRLRRDHSHMCRMGSLRRHSDSTNLPRYWAFRYRSWRRFWEQSTSRARNRRGPPHEWGSASKPRVARWRRSKLYTAGQQVIEFGEVRGHKPLFCS